MIAIIDYGVGNLFSLRSSLEYIGQKTIVTRDAEQLEKADKIVLPGVGAFGDAMDKLQQTGLIPTILEQTKQGKNLLGICLGMQLLFDKSSEYGQHKGLGLISGEVAAIEPDLPERVHFDGKTKDKLKVPHIGWNKLSILQNDPIFKYVRDGAYFYYVHSYYAKNCVANTLGTSDYDIPITGVVKNGSVYGTQFHPEKSGDEGLNLLRAFCEL